VWVSERERERNRSLLLSQGGGGALSAFLIYFLGC
jgi:hypothetical protein